MISCSHQGDHGCVPQAASATPIASASSSSARRRSISARAASGNDSQRPVLISISDEISSPAVCSPSGVASARALSSAKRLTRPCVSRVDDLELLLDREGEILRAVEDSARLVERRERVRDAQAHRRERTSAIASTAAAGNLPIRPPWSDRGGSYFLLLAIACVFGWSSACGPCRSSPSRCSRPSGRSPSGRASAARSRPDAAERAYVR